MAQKKTTKVPDNTCVMEAVAFYKHMYQQQKNQRLLEHTGRDGVYWVIQHGH